MPFAWVRLHGDRAYLSGHGLQNPDGSPAGPFGRVGAASLLSLLLALLLSGCASVHYEKVKTGELGGKLLVQWIEADKFILVPDKDKPLTFVRYNSESIIPGLMYTDGGSIPRPFQVFRDYSPWGYAPAFIIHDWLFHARHCKIPGYERYDVEDAAWIMSEVMKTMMEEPKIGVHKLTLYSMFEAVRSPIAKDLWDTGKCEQPPPRLLQRRPKLEYTIEFP